MPLPRESYTVEEVKARVTEKAIAIRVSSSKVEDGVDGKGKTKFKSVAKAVSIANESDMKPELVLSGPAQRGEVNVYVCLDGRKHYFDAKTGAALGSQLRSKERIRNPMKLIPPCGSDPGPRGATRTYLDR